MKPKGKALHPSASLPLIVDVNKDSTFPIWFFLYALHVFASSINFLFMYLSFFGDETQNMCHRGQAETNWTHETFPFHGERERESLVSLADIPLNLIHYCVVTLLSPHAGNWASCRALKYPDGGQNSQHSREKMPNCCSFLRAPAWTANCLCSDVSQFLPVDWERK